MRIIYGKRYNINGYQSSRNFGSLLTYTFYHILSPRTRLASVEKVLIIFPLKKQRNIKRTPNEISISKMNSDKGGVDESKSTI